MSWVLIGIVVFIIILLIILKVLNKKPSYQVTRMSGLEEQTSSFQKFLDFCCRHRK